MMMVTREDAYSGTPASLCSNVHICIVCPGIFEALGWVSWLNLLPLNFPVDKHRPHDASLALEQEASNAISCFH